MFFSSKSQRKAVTAENYIRAILFSANLGIPGRWEIKKGVCADEVLYTATELLLLRFGKGHQWNLVFQEKNGVTCIRLFTLNEIYEGKGEKAKRWGTPGTPGSPVFADSLYSLPEEQQWLYLM